MLKIGVIGFGYWGQHCQNFLQSKVPGSPWFVRRIEALQSLKRDFPSIKLTSSVDDIVKSPEIDVVAIVTPVSSHYELAKLALENGKHVFVENPLQILSNMPKSSSNLQTGKSHDR